MAAAAAARLPSPPIFLLSGLVDTGALTDEPEGGGWTKIECASKKAYGCGEHGQEAVEGLKLYVRLGDDRLLTYSLAIRMSDEALRRFRSELELGEDVLPTTNGFVEMAVEQDLTVILLVFARPFFDELAYYLVYDHVDASLSMIKYRPDLYTRFGTTKPVLKRHGSDFELFLMARGDPLYREPGHVLCVCTPETMANPVSDDGTSPWQIKTLHKEIQWPFCPAVAFSYQGKGFWADFTQGLVYCDLHTITGDPAVEFGFIRLPPEYQGLMNPLATKLTRTMACVRDSIWFVCIHYAVDSAADDLVKIWRLNVPGGNKWQEAWWVEVEVVSVSALWGLDSFKEAGLPQVTPEYPILLPDGALCVLLPNYDHQRNSVPAVDSICIFKLHGERGLLWHGVVHDYRFNYPVACPSNFLQRKHGYGSSKTKDEEHCPAAALATLAVGE